MSLLDRSEGGGRGLRTGGRDRRRERRCAPATAPQRADRRSTAAPLPLPANASGCASRAWRLPRARARPEMAAPGSSAVARPEHKRSSPAPRPMLSQERSTTPTRPIVCGSPSIDGGEQALRTTPRSRPALAARPSGGERPGRSRCRNRGRGVSI